MPARRFPPPWTVEDLDACFVVKDSGGQKLRLSLDGLLQVRIDRRRKHEMITSMTHD
jgi:hypothetical protein